MGTPLALRLDYINISMILVDFPTKALKLVIFPRRALHVLPFCYYAQSLWSGGLELSPDSPTH